MSCVKTRRLFIALWPPPAVRGELVERTAPMRVPVGARCVAPEEWHLTLEFLGVVPESARPALERLLAGFPPQPEPLVLDRLSYWPESRAGVLLPSRVPAALLQGHAWLRAQLQALGHRVDSRPFQPHVTLYHASTPWDSCAAKPAIVWPLRHLALVESSPVVGSSRYIELAAHELS